MMQYHKSTFTSSLVSFRQRDSTWNLFFSSFGSLKIQRSRNVNMSLMSYRYTFTSRLQTEVFMFLLTHTGLFISCAAGNIFPSYLISFNTRHFVQRTCAVSVYYSQVKSFHREVMLSFTMKSGYCKNKIMIFENQVLIYEKSLDVRKLWKSFSDFLKWRTPVCQNSERKIWEFCLLSQNFDFFKGIADLDLHSSDFYVFGKILTFSLKLLT